MKRLKWNTNDINFHRRNFNSLIFKFNNSKKWFTFCACMTTSSARSFTREMANHYGAKEVEMKYMYDEEDNLTEPEENIIGVLDLHKWDEKKQEYYTVYKFRVDVYKGPEFVRRIEYNEEDLISA